MVIHHQSTKPAIQSTTIWGGALAILPAILVILPDILTQIGPILGPQTAVVVAAIGGVVSILARVFNENKPISGVVTQKQG